MLLVWNNLEEKYYECQCKRKHISRLTNSAWKYICFEKMKAFCYKLISFCKEIAYVLTASWVTHLVNLYEGICICLIFQDWYLFCCYTMAIGKDQILDPEKFILSIYIVANYCNIYSEKFALNLIWIKNLKNYAYYFAP